MRYVIGVDGGATKTHALVVDDMGQALGFGSAGGSNQNVIGLEDALVEIGSAVNSALSDAQLTGHNVAVGCFCLCGAALPEHFTTLQTSVESLKRAKSVIIKNDTFATLRAGLSRSWGIALICGTGFNGAGRAPDGSEARYAALGTWSGDWVGGGMLGEEIIRAVMRGYDGRGQPTVLNKLVLQALDVSDEQTLMVRLFRKEIRERAVTALVPLLFEAALMGDEVARDLIIRAGTDLGLSANALIRRLSLQDTDVEVVLGGSVFKGKGPLLLDTIREVIYQLAPNAQLVRLKNEPVVGAALLALEAAGVTITPGISSQLDGSVRQLSAYPDSKSRETAN